MNLSVNVHLPRIFSFQNYFRKFASLHPPRQKPSSACNYIVRFEISRLISKRSTSREWADPSPLKHESVLYYLHRRAVAISRLL